MNWLAAHRLEINIKKHPQGQHSTSPPNHPRKLGWLSTTALAMGGSNQSLFLLTALFAGQGAISGQGSAAVPLLIVGVLLSWAAAPAWTELVLMYQIGRAHV